MTKQQKRHSSRSAAFLRKIGYPGTSDFGFLYDLPPGPKQSGSLRESFLDFAVTSDFADVAKDHCAPVCLTNLMLVLSRKGHPELLASSSLKETFRRIHARTGNGPVMTLRHYAYAYAADQGCRLRSRKVSDYEDVRRAIAGGEPVTLLLSDGLFDWHWVLVLGWTDCETADGVKHYLQIHDGWDRRAEYYYDLDHRSLWIAARAYRVADNEDEARV